MSLIKMSYAQVLSELEDVTYSKAISHYNDLKNSFYRQYSLAAKESIAEIEKIFKEDVIKEIENSDITEQKDLVNQLFEQVHQSIISNLKGDKSLQNLQQKLKQQAKSKKEKGSIEFTKGLNAILSESKMEDLILQNLSKYSAQSKGFDITDIMNQVRSYRNKVILVRNNNSAKYYKNVSKGYFREALVHKAFSKIGERLDGKVVAIPTGSKKVLGKDTVYDEFINLFNNIEKASFEDIIQESIDTNTGFGIQSKSWVAPWENNMHSYYGYSMSGQKELLSYLNKLSYSCDTWSWIHGVQFLENHLISAIGPKQLGFVTGKTFYWTGELIANFRQMNYFYAFIFNKEHKATSRTSWQTIDMNK